MGKGELVSFFPLQHPAAALKNACDAIYGRMTSETNSEKKVFNGK
jgi:hypothetical protein